MNQQKNLRMGIRRLVKPGSNTRVLFTKNYVKKSTLQWTFLLSSVLFACNSNS